MPGKQNVNLVVDFFLSAFPRTQIGEVGSAGRNEDALVLADHHSGHTGSLWIKGQLSPVGLGGGSRLKQVLDHPAHRAPGVVVDKIRCQPMARCDGQRNGSDLLTGLLVGKGNVMPGARVFLTQNEAGAGKTRGNSDYTAAGAEPGATRGECSGSQ
jgi:hypothetical protein